MYIKENCTIVEKSQFPYFNPQKRSIPIESKSFVWFKSIFQGARLYFCNMMFPPFLTLKILIIHTHPKRPVINYYNMTTVSVPASFKAPTKRYHRSGWFKFPSQIFQKHFHASLWSITF